MPPLSRPAPLLEDDEDEEDEDEVCAVTVLAVMAASSAVAWAARASEARERAAVRGIVERRGWMRGRYAKREFKV